jgi:hypothetical protein
MIEINTAETDGKCCLSRAYIACISRLGSAKPKQDAGFWRVQSDAYQPTAMLTG